MLPQQLVGGIDVYFQLARFFLVLFIGLFLTRAVLMPIASRLMRRRSRDKKRIYSMENLVAVLGIFATVIVALQAARFGSLVTVVGAVAAALTVAVGFGMREQVGNLVSGLFIQLDSPFVKEDYIVAEKAEGVVKEIKLRETRLRSPTGEKLVVPNGYLSNNPVSNRTRGRVTTDTVPVTVDAADAATAEQLFLQHADATPEILEDPEPVVYFDGFDDGRIRLQFQYAMKDSENVKQVRDRVVRAFLADAVDHGIFTDPAET